MVSSQVPSKKQCKEGVAFQFVKDTPAVAPIDGSVCSIHVKPKLSHSVSSSNLKQPLVDFNSQDSSNDCQSRSVSVSSRNLNQPLVDVYEQSASNRTQLIDHKQFMFYLHGYNYYKKIKVIQHVTSGVRIPSSFKGDKLHSTNFNHPSALEHSSFVSEKIQSELSKGKIAGPFDEKPHDLILSPLAVVPKKGDQGLRLVHNLSYTKLASVNKAIPKELCRVSYENLDHCVAIIAKLGRFSRISKCDIESAFRVLPVDKRDFHLLGFSWKNQEGKVQYFHDMSLPMGSSISCCAFEEFSSSLQWILKKKLGVLFMSHILDDFLFFGPHKSDICQKQLDIFLSLAKHLHIPIKPSKTVLPTTVAELHGIQVSTETMQLSLPPDKLQKALSIIKQLCSQQKASVKQIQSAVGFLNFCTKIVPSGRPFLRRLIDLIKGSPEQWYKVRLTKGVKQDLLVWRDFLINFNGRTIISSDLWGDHFKCHIFSDASGFAFAAINGTRWFYGLFPPTWKNHNIAIKEFVPVYLALRFWLQEMSNSKVLFHVDNESVMYNLLNQTSHLEEIMDMMRPMVLLSMQHSVIFQSTHILGKLNKTADYLSRLQFQKAFEHDPMLDRQPQHYPLSWLPWS